MFVEIAQDNNEKVLKTNKNAERWKKLLTNEKTRDSIGKSATEDIKSSRQEVSPKDKS